MTPSPLESDVLALARSVARRAGTGEQIEAYVATGTSTTVRAFDGDVEAFTSATAMGIGIRVIRDHRLGFASAGSHDPEVVADVLAEARDNARFAEPDETIGLAEPDGVTAVELDLWCEHLLGFPSAAKVALALQVEEAVRAADRRITGIRSAVYGDAWGAAAVASSNGLEAAGRSTQASVSVVALAADSAGGSQTGFGSDGKRDPNELDAARAAGDAAERATRLLGAVKPASGRLSIVLEPRLAAAVIGLVASTLTGEAVQKGRSPFGDRLGEAIASPLLTLVDDPTDGRSLAADTHDGEGLATRANTLITDGVLAGFLHDATTARRAGTRSTGSAVRSSRSTPTPGPQVLVLAPGTGDLDALVASTPRGVLVQSLNGLHSGVNRVSGDFSVGIEGLMIRDGALAEPVREATIASTLQRLLLDVRDVGADVEWLPGGDAFPTIVIDDVTLSGI